MPMNTMSTRYVTTSLAECGVALPPAAQAALDTLEAINAEAERDVVGSALEAVRSTALTPKNAGKKVTELATALVTRDRITEAAQHLTPVVLDQFRAAIADNRDTLLEALRPAFDHHAAVIHHAATLVRPGVTPDISDGADVVAAHNAIPDTEAALQMIRHAYIQVIDMAGYAEPDVTWFIESAADPDEIGLARVHFRRGWHALAHEGFRLRLNLPDEAAAVVSAAERRSAADAEAERRKRVEANRDPLRDAKFAGVLS